MFPKTQLIALCSVFTAAACFGTVVTTSSHRILGANECEAVRGGVNCWLPGVQQCTPLHTGCAAQDCVYSEFKQEYVCEVDTAKNRRIVNFPVAKYAAEGTPGSYKDKFTGESIYCFDIEVCGTCNLISGDCEKSGDGGLTGLYSESYPSGASCATHGP